MVHYKPGLPFRDESYYFLFFTKNIPYTIRVDSIESTAKILSTNPDQ